MCDLCSDVESKGVEIGMVDGCVSTCAAGAGDWSLYTTADLQLLFSFSFTVTFLNHRF